MQNMSLHSVALTSKHHHSYDRCFLYASNLVAQASAACCFFVGPLQTVFPGLNALVKGQLNVARRSTCRTYTFNALMRHILMKS